MQVIFAGIASCLYRLLQLFSILGDGNSLAGLLQVDAGSEVASFRSWSCQGKQFVQLIGYTQYQLGRFALFRKAVSQHPIVVGCFLVDDDTGDVSHIFHHEEFVFTVSQPFDESKMILFDDTFDKQLVDRESQSVASAQGNDCLDASFVTEIQSRGCKISVGMGVAMLNYSRNGESLLIHSSVDELLKVVGIDPVIRIAKGQIFSAGVFNTYITGRTQPPIGFVDYSNTGIFPSCKPNVPPARCSSAACAV